MSDTYCALMLGLASFSTGALLGTWLYVWTHR